MNQKSYWIELSRYLTKLIKSNIYFILLMLLALITRFLFLDNKPIHHDESVNGWFVLQMREMGYFRYNPENYHGPFLFYFLHVLDFIFGKSLIVMRAATSFMSLLSIALFMYWSKNKFKRYQWVALAWCLSPAFVFFSRSAIHESTFVFFQILFFLGLVDYLQDFSRRASWWMWTGVFGMATNKETFVISIFCALLSLSVPLWRARMQIWQRKSEFITDFLFAFLLILFMFAGFGRNFSGAMDFFRAFLPWMKTGTGLSGHEKEFYYWLQLMASNEWPALLGVLAAIWGLFQVGVVSKNKTYFYFSVFSLLHLLVYSAIPYKTPWCLLSVQWPFYFTLLFWLQDFSQARWLAYSTGLLSLGNLPVLYELNYRYPIELDHKYVYVQSTYDLKTMESILKSHENEKVIISCDEGWPFPWVLSHFKNLHYTRPLDLIEDFSALLIDQAKFPLIEKKLSKKYWIATLKIRDSREESLLLLNQDNFAKPNDPRFVDWQQP